MQATNNPVCEAVDIGGDILVNLSAPRRKVAPVAVEAVDGILAKNTNEIDSSLEVDALLVHDYHDHIVCVTLRLFNVVREDILKQEEERKLAYMRVIRYR